MSKPDFKVIFLGTQGTCAVSNPKKLRYGSNTLCVSVECGDHVFVFDMGTGFVAFSDDFVRRFKGPKVLDVFLSHYSHST